MYGIPEDWDMIYIRVITPVKWLPLRRQHITMKGSFKNIIQSETPVLIDFYADWCAPCKMLTPILKDVKQEIGDRLKVLKIDVDSNSSIASKYQIRGVPTMMLFKEGKVLWRQSGVMPKDAILDAIEPYLQS